MAEMLINQWGGIGDDPFLVRENECLDMDGIDIRTTPRKIQSIYGLSGSSATQTLSGNSPLNKTYDFTYGTIQLFDSNLYVGTYDVTSIVAGGYNAISVGYNIQTYNATTNPEGARHFIFQNDTTQNYIKVINYVTLAENLSKTIDTTTISTNTNNFLNRTTAVAYLWKGAIIFSRSNKIYELNPTTETIDTISKIELPIGAIVRYMYYYGGMIQILFVIEDDTYIQGCTYDGVSYKMNNYVSITKGEKCIDAYGNGGKIYWISSNGIYTYSGESIFTKKCTFTSSAKLSYSKGILRIGDGTNFYEYGINKPGYGIPLTRIVSPFTIAGVNESTIITYSSNKYYIDDRSRGYKDSCYYTLPPYTSGRFGVNKKGLTIVTGYILPINYIVSSTKCSIDLYIQTDRIFNIYNSLFIKVASITDETKNYHYTTQNMIAKALSDAGYTDHFGWIKIKVVLNNGDPTGSFFRKTPEVFDIYINHDEITNPS